MFSWLGISAVHPWLLWGAAAVAAPIIIHLLSKRRFRVVHWAAMDFLLEADRRNRRRIRLEHLILLMLRCLAMLLLALLVARLFFMPEGIGRAAAQSAGFERVFVLDDSPSMRAAGPSRKWAFDEAKAGLISFVEELATTHGGDRVTLLVTSQPEVPLLQGRYLKAPAARGAEAADAAPRGDGLAEIVQTIRNLEPSDRAADLARTLLAVENQLKTNRGHENRIVYLVTDLRRMDWTARGKDSTGRDGAAGPGESKTSAEQSGPVQLLRRVAKQAEGFVVVDVGADAARNLIVADIQLLDEADERSQLVAGVPAHFVVHVRNHGVAPAADVEVELSSGESGTQKATIPRINPGDSAVARFQLLLPRSEDPAKAPPDSVMIRAAVEAPDELPQDNERLFAGRLTQGVRVLVVDGDAGSGDEPFRSERHFLVKALAPAGDEVTPFRVEWRSDSQFDVAPALDPYQLIYLLNVYRLSEEQTAALAAWVKAGGGLAIALGDRIDVDWYNEKLFDGGKGLLPLRLDARQGDEKEETWVQFAVEDQRHPMFAAFKEALELVHLVKVFQWWRGEPPEAEIKAGRTVIPAALSDSENSPALVERSCGNGRVMAILLPLDRDFSDWPIVRECYVPWMLDMARYLARKPLDEANLLVGQPIRQRLDPADHKAEVKVSYAHPTDAAKKDAVAENAVLDEATKRLHFEYPATDRVGYYELDLARFDGERDRRLFAANLDPAEGDLSRIAASELARQVGEGRVQFISGRPSLESAAEGAKREFWFPILVGLMGVLGVEQFLAWLFGRRR